MCEPSTIVAFGRCVVAISHFDEALRHTHVMQLIKRQSMNGVDATTCSRKRNHRPYSYRVPSERIMCNNLRACATKWANKIFHFYANIFPSFAVLHSTVFANEKKKSTPFTVPCMPTYFVWVFIIFHALFSFVHFGLSICSGELRDADTFEARLYGEICINVALEVTLFELLLLSSLFFYCFFFSLCS